MTRSKIAAKLNSDLAGSLLAGERIGRIFINRFGHLRAGWRIAPYLALAVGFFILTGKIKPFISFAGGSLSGFQAVANRLIEKSLQLLAVLFPCLALLRWLDKRPVALLGLAYFNGAFRELMQGMLITTGLVAAHSLLLWITGLASFTFNGFSTEMGLLLSGYLIILIISAMYEEILFRGYIFQALIEGSRFWITLLAFAVLFGSAHLSNENVTPFGIAFTISAGLFLGILYYKTRSLWMPIGAHFMWNWGTGPVFGMGIDGKPFIRKTLFSFHPTPSGFPYGVEGAGDLFLSLLVSALAVLLWKARWLQPAGFNKNLWAKYPPGFKRPPEIEAGGEMNALPAARG